MALFTKENVLNIKIDASELSAVQARTIKTLVSTILKAATTNEESDYFEASAETMKICAALIKQANFAQNLKDGANIPYADQAVAYSMDLLEEHLINKKVISYDN